jgi:hypothetical protein
MKYIFPVMNAEKKEDFFSAKLFGAGRENVVHGWEIES